MKKVSLLISAILVCNSLAYSQESLLLSLNSYRAGDKIIKQQMTFPVQGSSGVNQWWDFSNLSIIDDYYPLIYFRPVNGDTEQIAGIEHQTRYFYNQTDNTLWMTAYDNRSVKMTFDQPELQMRFPLQYGDTLSAAFQGNGLGYQEMEVVASGRTFLHADATGTLITPGGDTLRNVLRVKRLRIYSNIGVEGASMRLETYSWYAPGYRYPVFETVRSQSTREDVTQEDFTTAFYFPIAAIESLNEDPENEAIRMQTQQETGILLACSINPNPVDNYCNLSFELSVGAKVSIRLCTILGFPVSVIQQQIYLPSGQHEKSIPMNGLQRGHYVLYIQTNNDVTRQVIIKN